MIKKKPILIVEDELVIQESLKQILEISGYTVYLAENGLIGSRMLEQIPTPGLILLDLMMPVMNGPHFFKLLKEDHRYENIPVVLISGLIQKGKETLPAEGFLEKPINFQDLLNVVEKFCGKK